MSFSHYKSNQTQVSNVTTQLVDEIGDEIHAEAKARLNSQFFGVAKHIEYVWIFGADAVAFMFEHKRAMYYGWARTSYDRSLQNGSDAQVFEIFAFKLQWNPVLTSHDPKLLQHFLCEDLFSAFKTVLAKNMKPNPNWLSSTGAESIVGALLANLPVSKTGNAVLRLWFNRDVSSMPCLIARPFNASATIRTAGLGKTFACIRKAIELQTPEACLSYFNASPRQMRNEENHKAAEIHTKSLYGHVNNLINVALTGDVSRISTEANRIKSVYATISSLHKQSAVEAKNVIYNQILGRFRDYYSRSSTPEASMEVVLHANAQLALTLGSFFTPSSVTVSSACRSI